jgi:hypothetical protein
MVLEYYNDVKCTKQEAWKLITNLERRPDWIPFMEKCYFTDFKEGWIDSKYQEKEVFLNIPLNINYEVIEYHEYKRLRSRCLMPPFYPKVDVTVEEKNGYCKCGLILDVKLGPFALIPKSIIKPQIDNLIMPLVNNFKSILESESSLK